MLYLNQFYNLFEPHVTEYAGIMTFQATEVKALISPRDLPLNKGIASRITGRAVP